MKYDTLDLWSTHPGQAIWVGGRRLAPAANMIVFGALFSREGFGAVQHRTATAWPQIWSIKQCLLTRTRRNCVRPSAFAPLSCLYFSGHARRFICGRTPSVQQRGYSSASSSTAQHASCNSELKQRHGSHHSCLGVPSRREHHGACGCGWAGVRACAAHPVTCVFGRVLRSLPFPRLLGVDSAISLGAVGGGRGSGGRAHGCHCRRKLVDNRTVLGPKACGQSCRPCCWQVHPEWGSVSVSARPKVGARLAPFRRSSL